MTETKKFENFPDAFDYIREKGCPEIVRINGELWKLFPSGYAKLLFPSGHARKLTS